MKLFRLLSEYRWPIYIGGHLTLSVVACGVLVWVATRPDAPRPIAGYYRAAQTWDADEGVQEASRQLGWTVRYDVATGLPHYPGMPRPVDVTVTDRERRPVAGLVGELVAIRASDARPNAAGELVAVPTAPGRYRTLIRLDDPGTWEFRLDTRQQAMRFVHVARFSVPADPAGAPGVGTR